MTDGLPFRAYQEEMLYQVSGEGEAGRQITIHEHALISHAKDAAIGALNRMLPASSFHSGRYRWLPDGVEHDLLYQDEVSGASARVTLFQKLNNPQVIRTVQVDGTQTVHMVLSLKGRLDKYTTFLHHLSTNILPHDPHLTLTIASFDPNTHQVQNLTSAGLASFPNFRWNVLPLGGEAGDSGGFSRGKGLHLGALKATSAPGDLIFFCDVDVLMKADFFRRCRANTLLGRQVYYPIIFSLYNPSLVYPLLDKPVPPVQDQLAVGEHTGFWREFGYGMACVTRGDYLGAGGYPDIRTWGGEDEALYQQFLTKDHIKVIRAPDPSLFHLHHAKECSEGQGVAYVACLKSRANTEGSKVQLGLTLLKAHHGTDIEGVLSKRFYYFWLVPYLGGLLTVSLLTNLLLATLLLTWARRAARVAKKV